MRRPLIITVAAVVVLGVAACSDDDDSASADVSAGDLDDRTFVSEEVAGQTLVPGTEITLTFLDEAVCPDELQAQDEWLAESLGSEPEVQLADDVLTLTSGEVTITAIELA